MDALLVEAVPAVAQRSLAEAGQVPRAVVAQDVVLAGHVKHLRGLGGGEHLRHRVELVGLREVAYVARVEDELRRLGEGVDPVDRLLKGANDIGVGGLVESDVGIADLDEIQFRGGERARIGQRIAERARGENAAGNGADHRRAGPAHAAKKAPAIDAIVTGVVQNNIVIDHRYLSCLR